MPTELGGNVEFFAFQVLRCPGRVDMLCPAQPVGEDRVLVQQEVFAGHGYLVCLKFMGIQLPGGKQDRCDKH